MRFHSTPSTAARRGVVLLVVMAMLALFASVALSFVFYAESEATASRYHRQGETKELADVEPELLLSYFLGQFIYDTNDIFSVMRGHSLARTMYGYNQNALSTNNIPFNGAGLLQYDLQPFGAAAALNNIFAVNYQSHPGDGFLRHPEHYGWDPNNKGPYLGGANVPSTYPSLNNMFLGALNGNGEILIQSFYRPWTFAQTNHPAWQKYLSLRPHKSHHPQFADPEDGGGDVRNVDFGRGVKKPGGGYWNNDSYWMDLGFPVMTAANGKKYKPLFAAFVIDLDGKINLWAAGNIHEGSKHVSRQGLGRWEVNPSVLVPFGELKTGLTQGGGAKYGPNGAPDAAVAPTLLGPAPYYSPYDGNGLSAGNLVLPNAGAFTSFPTAAGWSNGAVAPNHPARFGHLKPQGDDARRWSASNMEALLRYGGKGSPALTSEIFKRLPSLANVNAMKQRHQLTLLSMDFDRAGVAPYIKYNPAAASQFAFVPALGYPRMQYDPAVMNFPTPGNPPAAASDFSPDWRGRWGAELARINLHRPLTDYPAANANGVIDLADAAILAQFGKAHQDRNRFAQDLYNSLSKLTGARADLNGLAPDDPMFRANRYLAQLAVNIVDYLDPDEVNTPYLWTPPGAATGPETLFGVEPPKVVLNEAYVQFDNDPTDPGLQTAGAEDASIYKMNVWAELYNPFRTTTTLFNVNSNYAIYRIQLARTDATLRSPENNLGRPVPANDISLSSDWGGAPTVEPGDNQLDNTNQRAFFIQGPKPNNTAANHFLAGRHPGFAEHHKSAGMSKTLPLNDPLLQAGADGPTILLQRLANPFLPHNEADSTAINYNPYITVDYLEKVPAWNNIQWIGNAMQNPLLTNFSTYGRRQPFAAHPSQQSFQNPIPVPANQPKNTMGRQNRRDPTMPVNPDTLDTFQWLVHLDRKPINSTELLYVCGFRTHELTQQFIQGAQPPVLATDAHKHLAPWFDKEALLYRLFEFATVPDLMNGPQFSGRKQGLVNINTVWDVDTFLALADPQPGSHYDAAAAAALFNRLALSRTPNGIVTKDDRAFKTLAVGYIPPGVDPQSPIGASLDDTLAGRRDATGRILELPNAHPYQKNELLMKLFTNVTTRSNVFAVWVTVGFFEVTDDSVQPPRLGLEIGKEDNRHIRHRFFAIVDRTEMRIRPVSTTGQEFNLTLANGVTVPPGQTGSLTLTFNDPGRTDLNFQTVNGQTWTITARAGAQPGTLVTISPNGPNEETVEVVATSAPGVSPAWFQVNALQSHAAGEEVIFRANPGPWVRYNVRQDPRVVPHYSVIE